MRRDLRVFCLEVTGSMMVPWDTLSEGAAEVAALIKSGHPAKGGPALAAHHKQQGFVDAGKDSPLKLPAQIIVDQAMNLLRANPKSTSTFIRDPQGVFDPAGLKKLATRAVTGRDSLFWYDTNDDEIFADGPEGFMDMEWGYWVTSSIATGQNNAIDSSPPKVSVEQVQGKTGAGWRIVISKPYQFYLDAGEKVGEKQAAQLAKKKIFPVQEPSTWGNQNSSAYVRIRDRWAR